MGIFRDNKQEILPSGDFRVAGSERVRNIYTTNTEVIECKEKKNAWDTY